MSEEKLLGKVSIPEECAKWFRCVRQNGEVWAIKPGRMPLSSEEKAKRKAIKIDIRQKRNNERLKARNILVKAKRKAKEDLTTESIQQFRAAEEAYKQVMSK